MRSTRRGVGRVWCHLDRRLERLAGRQTHGSTRSFDFRQIPGGTFEVLGHVAAGLGDVGQRATRSRWASLTGTPSSPTRGLRLFLCATRSCSRTIGRRTCLTEARGDQRGTVECDFTGAQSRPGRAPILGVHKAFQLLQPRFGKFFGIDRSIDQTFFPSVLHHARPGGSRTLGVGGDPVRAQVDEAQPHADSPFENALISIDPGVGYGRDGVTDVVSEELDEPAACVLLACDDLTIGRLHEELDCLLASPGFLPKMLQYGVDVLDDLFDLIPRVTVDDEHDVVTEVAQRLDPAQQVADRGLGVVDLARERVDGASQRAAQLADNRCGGADLSQSFVDLLAFGNVLAVEERLRCVESSSHAVGCRTEGTPTRRGRTQTRHITIGPCLEDKRLHERPQRWGWLAGPPRARRPRCGEVGRRGRWLQSSASAAQRRSRIDVGVVRCALLDDGRALAARVDGGRCRPQHRLGLLLIRQAEHLAGSVNTGVGGKAGRQYRQICGQPLAGGLHRAARGVQRLGINHQRSHAQNSCRDRAQPLFTQ
ncbi:hypothetical protein A5695_14485 [Mycobacterium sp. E1747]|nr:hypothetical protein A5695_14485 [Mycobacterium sp. E1747]